MDETKLDDQIIAIYNPYLRELMIYYKDHNCSESRQFDSDCDWQYFYHPVYKDQFLHVQLDYDECAQLIIYFERDIPGGRQYDDCISWHSLGHKDSSIFIVHSDIEWDMTVKMIPNLEFYKGTRHLKVK